jgi:hypothetical protein
VSDFINVMNDPAYKKAVTEANGEAKRRHDERVHRNTTPEHTAPSPKRHASDLAAAPAAPVEQKLAEEQQALDLVGEQPAPVVELPKRVHEGPWAKNQKLAISVFPYDGKHSPGVTADPEPHAMSWDELCAWLEKPRHEKPDPPEVLEIAKRVRIIPSHDRPLFGRASPSL